MTKRSKTQLEKITERLIADLCRSDERPDDWLPHTVYVEEVGEDESLGEIPVYTRYTLDDYEKGGSCTLRNSEGESRSGHLHEICIDWLFILRDRYLELTAEQGLWRERAIHLLEQETDATLPDIIEFVEDHWQNLATDEENIGVFRCWLEAEKKLTKTIYKCNVCGGTDVACDARINPNTGEILNFFDDMDGECAKCGEVDLDVVETEIEEDAVSKKELFAFVWPYQLMSRNATNEQIIAAYENGPLCSDDEDDNELYEVLKLTPDELAAEINDNDCAFGQYYVRFIEIA